MDSTTIFESATTAINAFLKGEAELISLNANERSLTHKLAEYLQREFSELNVDCEYNRLGTLVKRLPPPQPSQTDDESGRTIFPDIIVHKRNSKDNWLVVEVKKSTNKTEGDDEKLRALTQGGGDFAYTLGIHLIIDCSQVAVTSLTCYANGNVIHNPK